ncbi:MAG: hypothetical protein JNM26_08175 [Ideonella sp.]|nr:hypothetical protein [Ideonella sp.]
MHPAYLLIAASATVVGTLGGQHLLYTFHGRRLHPREPALREAMERSALVITRQTTVWRALKGFNATHALGILAFALVYGHLAVWRLDVLAASPFLMALGMAVLLAYGALARRYFFSVPYRGVVLASALYGLGWVLA